MIKTEFYENLPKYYVDFYSYCLLSGYKHNGSGVFYKGWLSTEESFSLQNVDSNPLVLRFYKTRGDQANRIAKYLQELSGKDINITFTNFDVCNRSCMW